MAEPSVAGISGGRTSAMMAFDLPPETILTFQNTGEEHSKTLEFLCRLEEDLRRPIVRIEWRPPPRLGDRPKLFSFATLAHGDLARHGEPFAEMLRYLNAYRKEKGEPAISPYAARRLCTAYLKIMPCHRFASATFGDGEDYTSYVGIRADEPDRLNQRGIRACVTVKYPLADRGVTKADVMQFWSKKSYDLELDEALGNCRACFMKDERDLATALLDSETDPQFYIEIEKTYGPMRRGGRPSYAQVLAEAPDRMKIRRALRLGIEPVPYGAFNDPTTNFKRFRLVVAQEKVPRKDWSCSCPGAEALAAEDDE